jgi:hypothetical protein
MFCFLKKTFSLLVFVVPLIACQAESANIERFESVMGFEGKTGKLQPNFQWKVAESYAEFTQEQAYEGKTSLKFFFQSADGHGARAEYDATALFKGMEITQPGGALEFYALPREASTFRLQLRDAKGKKIVSEDLTALLTPGKWQRVLVPIAFEVSQDFDSEVDEDKSESKKKKVINLPVTLDRFLLKSESNTLYVDRFRYVPETEYQKLLPQEDKGEWTISHPQKKVLWFKPGETASIPIGFQNSTASNLNINYSITVEDFWGNQLSKVENKTTLRSGANPSVHSVVLDTNKMKYGGYFIKALAKDNSGAIISEIEFTFGIIGEKNATRGQAGDFLYGGEIAGKGIKDALNPSYPNWYTAEYFGIDMARIVVSFEDIWPKKDRPWNWETWDKFMENHKRIGVKPYILVGLFPPHLAGNFFRPPDDLSPFYKYVEQIVQRYKDDVDTYEIWNEADWAAWEGSTEKYIEMYLKCYEIIKQNDPDAKIMNSGWAFSDRRGSFPKIKKFLEKVPPEKLDIFAFHAHGSDPEIHWKMKKIREFLASSGHNPNMEIWDTESGRVGDDRFVAQQLVKKHINFQVDGGKHLQWFTLGDSRREAKRLEHKKKFRVWRWGMFRSKYLEPKPQAIAYWALIKTLRGYKYQKTLNLSNDLQAFVFSNGDNKILVYWLEQLGKKNFTLEAEGIENPKQIDIFGNEQVATLKNNQIVLEATSTPAYLKWRGKLP